MLTRSYTYDVRVADELTCDIIMVLVRRQYDKAVILSLKEIQKVNN